MQGKSFILGSRVYEVGNFLSGFSGAALSVKKSTGQEAVAGNGDEAVAGNGDGA